MDIFELSNVELSSKMQTALAERKREHPEAEPRAEKMILPVIQRLATLNPLWTFVGTDRGYDGNNNSMTITEFAVREHGEELGRIGRQHYGSKYVIYVSNDRIAKSKTRSNGYRTVDADKAVLHAKKMFFKLKPNERIEKATKDAESVINTQRRMKDRDHYHAEGAIRTAALDFIMGTGFGFSVFLEHIKTRTESERTKLEKAMEDKARLSDEMMTIDKAKSAFENGKTALVIRDGGKYLVKIGDKVDLYDDNTLPDWMRGKLGMLKLVQAEQFVSNTGCRVNEETFVLMVEED